MGATCREVSAPAYWQLSEQKFDVTLNWGLKEKPRNQQKPAELVKQKPDKEKKKLMNRNVERAKQLGIEYVKKQMVK